MGSAVLSRQLFSRSRLLRRKMPGKWRNASVFTRRCHHCPKDDRGHGPLGRDGDEDRPRLRVGSKPDTRTTNKRLRWAASLDDEKVARVEPGDILADRRDQDLAARPGPIPVIENESVGPVVDDAI